VVADSVVGNVTVELPTVAVSVLACLVACGTELMVAAVLLKLSQLAPIIFAALLLPLVELHQMNTAKRVIDKQKVIKAREK